MKSKLKSIVKSRFPSLAGRLTSNRVLNVDWVLAQDSKILLCGWIADKTAVLGSTALSASGKPLSVFTFDRDDVVASMQLPSPDCCFGFLAVLDGDIKNIGKLTIESEQYAFEMARQRYRPASSAAEVLSHVPAVQADAKKFVEKKGFDIAKSSGEAAAVVRQLDPDVKKIKQILDATRANDTDFFETLEHQVLPQLQRTWKNRIAKYGNSKVASFGDTPGQACVSIIIPLYGRYDFLQHQIAQFSADPDMQHAEVIFVLDDPELEREVALTAHGVFKTFRYPFKVVFSDKNRGFAGANNLGAEYATTSRLLLLNSDILPSQHGWLSELNAQFDQAENCGMLGATLLYEDDTIQHAGMAFARDSHYPAIWMNHHPHKGVPVDLVDPAQLFEVPLVTGACMLLEKAMFDEIGGFDPMYILGDFEDSDLCLKVHNTGKKIYCSGHVRLYHLERLSQDLVDKGDWKFKLTLANGTYQKTKWGNLIEELAQ